MRGEKIRKKERKEPKPMRSNREIIASLIVSRCLRMKVVGNSRLAKPRLLARVLGALASVPQARAPFEHLRLHNLPNGRR